jgi:fibronectin type 3 domain-containing protein
VSVTPIASTTAEMNGGVTVTVTVPTGVTTSHFGIVLLTSNTTGTTDFNATGFTQRIENPTGQTNHEIYLATKLGGLAAGNTFTVTANAAHSASISAHWFDTQGRDVNSVGTAYTRGGTSLTTNAIPGIASLVSGQDVFIFSTERTTVDGTTITGWSPDTPTQQYFNEFAATTDNSHYIGTLTPTAAASTHTVTYSGGSGNGFGVMIALDAPAGGDTTAPTVPTGVGAVANSPTSVTVSWTASTDAVGVASYRVRRGGVDVTGATAVTGTSFTDTSVAASTAYSYTVSAVDAAGNRSAESSAATVTTPAPDTTAPTVPTGVNATANSPTQVTVAWNPSTDAVGVTSYRVQRGGVTVTGAGAVTGTTFVDTTVSASTAYSYTVSAVDAAGNRSAESTAATATTPAPAGGLAYVNSAVGNMAGVSPLTITVPAGVTSSHFGILILTSNAPGTADYDAPGWLTRYEHPAGENNHEVFVATRLGGLAAGQTFTVTSTLVRTASISVHWFDTGGRDLVTAGTAYTRAGSSLTTNTIPGIAALSGSQDTFVISTERTTADGTTVSSWSPDTPTQVYYNEFATTTDCSHYVGVLSGTLAANAHTITYSGASGNGFGAMLALVSGGGSDTTPPSVPGSVTATANSSTQVTLGWAASSDGVGVTSYRVRRGGVDLAGATALTGTSFVDTTVSASTVYNYTVSAVDAAGNRSAESAVASVTTPAPPDTTPPTVPTALSATPNSATQVTLSWTASTDNVGVANYRIQRDGVTLSAGAAVTGTTFADTSVSGSTTYSYTVSAVDAAGNRSAESTSASATTPAGGTTSAVASLSWSSLPSATELSLGWMVDSGTTVQAVASLSSDLSSPILGTVTSRAASGWANSRVSGLTANTSYYTGLRVDGVLIATGRGQYTTLKTGLVASKIITSSCNITGSTHVVFTRIKSEAPDFFVHQGDIHYADLTTYNDASWRSAFTSSVKSSTFSPMLASVTTTYSPDNHDGPGSSSGGGIGQPWSPAVSADVRELTGEIYTPQTQGFYKTWVHAGIRYIEMDCWTFRNAGTDAQSPTKTMLGAAQKAWLLNLFQTAPEPVIVVFSHFPHYSNLVANGRWGDFNNERQEIGNAIAALPFAQRDKLIFVGGDSHAINADDGANAMWGRPSLNASPLNQSGGPSSGNWNIANIDVPDTRGYYSRLNFVPGTGIVTMTWDAVQDDGTVMATYSRSFTTDTTAPTTPTSLNAVANSSVQVTLTWTASTDAVGVVSYRVRRDGVDLATAVSGTTYIDTGVVAGTSYSYTVSAVDAAGNRSNESGAATVTTPVPTPPSDGGTPAPTPDPITPLMAERTMLVTAYSDNYVRIGQIADYISCAVTWQWMGTGSGELVVGEDNPIAPYLLTVNTELVAIVVQLGDLRWSGRVTTALLERDGPPGSGVITATLISDFVWLQWMIASQNGSNPSLTGMSVGDARGGPAASVAADYINAAAVRLGLPVLATKPPVDASPSVQLNARMTRLTDLLVEPLKNAGVTMDAKIWLPGDAPPDFVTMAPTEPTVVFSPRVLADKPWLQWTDSMTNISDLKLQVDQPTAYRAIVGLGGTDAARVYDSYVDTARQTAIGDFGLPEVYVDASDAALGAQSQDAGKQAVADDEGGASAVFSVPDAAPWIFGVDYVVGDMATVEVNGSTWRERITRVTAKDERDTGLTFTPLIGDEAPSVSGDEMMVRALAQVAEGLRALQAGR